MLISRNNGTLPDKGPELHAASLSRRSLLGFGAAALFMARIGGGAAQAAVVRRSIYVSKTGSDSNPGTADKPFATINGVFNRISDLGGGDRIVVMPGTYYEAVNVKAGGTAVADLMLVSQVPYGAKIRSPASSYSAINIQKNYVTVDGFDVQGGGTGHGIEATFLDGSSANNGPHHITIVNNISHDNAGSGISTAYGDYYLIDNNICYRNCATNSYQGSGISIYEPRAAAGSDDLRIIVSRNTSYSNTALNLTNGAEHSDGNGIIIDDFRNTQQNKAPYPYKTLVENNVCYFNGGKGIHVFFSDNVTVRNNTCYFNNRDSKNPATWRGELSNVSGSNTVWVNNIGYADIVVNAYNRAILDGSVGGQINSNVVWMRNISFNGTPGSASITQSPYNPTLTSAAPYANLLGVDPLFVSAGQGVTNPDLHLKSASKARNSAVAKYGIGTIDRDGYRRNSGIADLGAYEIRTRKLIGLKWS
jgi:parallel beta-helix repeat protein